MKIVLIGFMGSGKTTVASLLGVELKTPVIEMDHEIVRTSGKSSLPEIFAEGGEAHFRALETEVAQSLSSLREGIISTGGGAILRSENVAALRKRGGIFLHLKTSFPTLVARIGGTEGGTEGRPLFQNHQEAEKLFLARQRVYEEHADFTIVTDGKTPQQVADEIIAILPRDDSAY